MISYGISPKEEKRAVDIHNFITLCAVFSRQRNGDYYETNHTAS